MNSGAQAKLQAYVDLVAAWSPRLGLVSDRDLGRFRERHVEDCLRILPLVKGAPPGPCADVGSGAGLPGIPLAIAGPPRLWRLIEPRRKRAAFLEEVVRRLELDCEVLPLTAADAAVRPELAAAHALAAARALAPPAEVFDALTPLVAPGGLCVAFVGPDASIPPEAEEWQQGVATITR